jgi:hypothetical protein
MKQPKIGFYIMSGQRVMDGPFDNQQEAEEFLAKMCGPWSTPELLAQFLAHFDGKMLDLVKDGDNKVIDGYSVRHRQAAYISSLDDDFASE